MKGVIVLCLKELVQKNYGEDKWLDALRISSIEKEPAILPISDVDDALVLKVVDSLLKVLDISMTQLGDAFGDYWVNVYSQRMYSIYYKESDNAKDFLLKMDEVHYTMTKKMKDAHPPRFDYEWKDDKTMIMHYKSRRGLIDIMIGLIKAVGKYYNEPLKVEKLGEDKVSIIFP